MQISKILLFNGSGTPSLTLTNSNIVETHIPRLYIATSGGSNAYDYALITVTEDLSEYACFNLGVMLDEFKTTNTAISSTGFPESVNSAVVNTSTTHNMYTGTGTVLNVSYFDTSRQFCFNNDVTPGDSGEPVYLTSTFQGKVYYTVIGITTASASNCNVANRINSNILHFYKSNPNL